MKPETPRPAVTDLLSGLNAAQREAASAIHGPVLVIAGPGSGKTRALTHRVGHLISTETCTPWQILALTFTNKAAREMKARITDLVGEERSRGIWMGTFHSIFARLLRSEADALGYDSSFSIYDTDDTERILKTLMAEYGIDPQQTPVRTVRAIISSAKNAMVSTAEFERLARTPAQSKVAKIYQPYQQVLARSNAMDFDDLLLKPIDLFTRFPDILEKYQDRWRFIHIDEYQDTNKAQYELTKLLATKQKNICVVGDDAQSIYSFRGADIGNILSFQRDYPDASVIRLEQNYRSTQKILRLADAIISNNSSQLDKTLWTENGEGSDIVLMESLSERDEAQKIASRVRDFKVREGLHYHQFAVLYRTNYQSRSIEDAFRRASIPYRVVGGVSFYQRKEIKDVLAYLRLVVNPNDSASLLRVINYPTRGIGKKSIERIQEFMSLENVTMWQACQRLEEIGLPKQAANSLAKFVNMLQGYTELSETDSAADLTHALLDDSGLIKDMQKGHASENLVRFENVQELVSAITEFDASYSGGNALSAFLQEVSLSTDADEQVDDYNRVTLMTLHASKGLEFPVVFVSGLEEGLFPLARAVLENSELEEERRLFYVGVTRAERHLVLSYAKSRYRFGEQQVGLKSRFLDEVGDDVIVTEAGKSFSGRSRRFSRRANQQSTSYADLDPAYYKQSLRPNQNKAPSGRRIVYDEEEGGIVPGVMVEHDQFGEGKVLSMDGSGNQAKATVFFPDYGHKKLVLRFARLRRIG